MNDRVTLPIPIVVGVTGHRDPDPSSVDAIRREFVNAARDLAKKCKGVPLVLLTGLAECSLRFRLPEFALTKISWQEIVTGVVVLGFPQVALTLGNAIIATVEENNTLFPDRRITVKAIAVDHGIMNLVGTSLGGVPMCHGAGGMAGHVRFGARTGGALVILGALILFIGLFLSDSVATLFKLFPRSLLGVILLFGGLELAAGAHGNGSQRGDRYVVLLTAGISLWNMGVGYLAGLALWHALQREWLRI